MSDKKAINEFKSSLSPATVCLTVLVCFVIFWGCQSGGESGSPVQQASNELTSTMLYQRVLDSSTTKTITPDGGFRLIIPAHAVPAKNYRINISRTNALAIDETLAAQKIALPGGMFPVGNIYTVAILPETTASLRAYDIEEGVVYLRDSAIVEFTPVTPFDFVANNYYVAYGKIGEAWQFYTFSDNAGLTTAINTIENGASFCLVKSPKTTGVAEVMLKSFALAASPTAVLTADATTGKFTKDLTIMLCLKYTGTLDLTTCPLPILTLSSASSFKFGTISATTASNGLYKHDCSFSGPAETSAGAATYTLTLSLNGVSYNEAFHPGNIILNAKITIGTVSYIAEAAAIGFKKTPAPPPVPTVEAKLVSPAQTELNAVATMPAFIVGFSQKMLDGAKSALTIKKQDDGSAISLSYLWSDSYTALTASPTTPLSYGTAYTLSINKTLATSLSGAALDDFDDITFVTEAFKNTNASLTCPEQIKSVATDSAIILTFNNKIDTLTASTSNIVIKANGVEAAGTLTASDNSVTFIASGGFAYGAEVSVEVNPVYADSKLKDYKGAEVNPGIFSFKTAAADRSTAVLVSPDSVGPISVLPEFRISFNKTMRASSSGAVSLIKSASSAIIPLTFKWSADQMVLAAAPSSELEHGIKYTLKVNWALATCIQGLAMLPFSDVEFTTQAGEPGVLFGGSGTLSDPYLVSNADDLRLISKDSLDKHFKQTADIDLSALYSSGDGFAPIGSKSEAFSGVYDGGGFKITGVYINRPENSYLGLFGFVNGGEIHNLTLENASVVGKEYVGALVGCQKGGVVSNCSVSGEVSAKGSCIGGLIGCHWGGAIEQCCSSAEVSSTGVKSGEANFVGGLIGEHKSGTVLNCYSTGSVSALGSVSGSGGFVGGLLGLQQGGSVANCFSSSGVNASGVAAGGLVGQLNSGTLSTCVALNPWVRSKTNSNRVAGVQAQQGVIVDCRAWVGIKTGPNPTDVFYESSTVASCSAGLDAATADINSISWWGDTNNWAVSAWNVNVWDFSDIDIENLKYPKFN